MANPKIIPQMRMDLQGLGKERAKAKTSQKPTIPTATSGGTQVSNQLKTLNKSFSTSKHKETHFPTL